MKLCAEQIRGTINAVPSKSALHRRLILNRIAGNADVPTDACGDVQTLTDCLNRLGSSVPLDCRDCGAALRFLLPVSLLYGGSRFDGSDALKKRPILPLINALCAHGAAVSSPVLPLTLSGTLQPGTYALDGRISSQFFSGLMLTLPFLPGDSTLLWTTPLGSLGYVHMTEQMLKGHGVTLVRTENGYSIPGGQTPRALPLQVEGDWSSAAPILILGAIAGTVSVNGLCADSLQPDRKVLDLLEQCGAQIEIADGTVTVRKDRLCGFKCAGDDAPDLVPVAAALACACEGDSVLYRLGRLRYKESDRFDAVCAMLDAVGADYECERADTIVIHGSEAVRGGMINVPPDHRMVMAAAVLSACSTAGTTIRCADAVEKSYPRFFDDFCRIGGQIDAI